MWKKILHNAVLYTSSVLDFFFPRYCLCCRQRLSLHEELLCCSCLINMPKVRHSSYTDNELTHIFWGLIPIEKGTALFHYTKNSPYSRILFALKYNNHPEVGTFMGRIIAEEFLPKRFFEDVDLIVPVPLSTEKLRKRGYNQSERIAKGLSEITGLEVNAHCIKRVISNPSQTTLTEAQRRTNVQNIFKVTEPKALSNKHILLIDDVTTTGATLLSCAETIAKEVPVRISIITLGWAGHS